MVFENAGPLDMFAGFLRASIINDQIDDFTELEIDSTIGLGESKLESLLGIPSRFNEKTSQVGPIGDLE